MAKDYLGQPCIPNIGPNFSVSDNNLIIFEVDNFSELNSFLINLLLRLRLVFFA